jgi:hypothetical protein
VPRHYFPAGSADALSVPGAGPGSSEPRSANCSLRCEPDSTSQSVVGVVLRQLRDLAVLQGFECPPALLSGPAAPRMQPLGYSRDDARATRGGVRSACTYMALVKGIEIVGEAAATACSMLNRWGRAHSVLGYARRPHRGPVGERTDHRAGECRYPANELPVFPAIEWVRVSGILEVIAIHVSCGPSPPRLRDGRPVGAYYPKNGTRCQVPAAGYSLYVLEAQPRKSGYRLTSQTWVSPDSAATLRCPNSAGMRTWQTMTPVRPQLPRRSS